MTPLTEFLLARIADLEALARAAMGKHETDDAGHWEFVEYPYEGGSPEPRGSLEAGSSGYDPGLPWTDLVNHFDPARVLAECEAKRRIVERHYTTGDDAMDPGLCGEDDFNAPCPTLRILASIYADHPDYREEWRA